jgi:mycobactin peptide synthetase MbtE
MVFQTALLSSLSRNDSNVAIEIGTRKVLYRELLKSADQVTSLLLKNNLEKDTIVGVMLYKRDEIIASMIGVMNARCAFVPIDPTWPAARIRTVIDTLKLQYIITLEDVSVLLDITHLTRISFGKLASAEERPRYPKFDEEDSLYVYLTSGSTGVPKAILGKNSSLIQFIQWEMKAFSIGEGWRFSQFISPYFDAFLRDVFVPLLSGGTICIPPDDLIAPWVNTASINFIHCVPSLFRILNHEHILPDTYSALRYILLSGEKIIPTDLVKWYDTFGDSVQLVNLYGATETTMIRSYYKIKPSDVVKSRIPIGNPIDDTELLVLQNDLKPCPKLVAGDLYIVSEYITKGYIHAPELNRDRFLQINGKPAFKTGDKARVLMNGEIDLIGREDRQVKVRGIRVELDEIESALAKSELVEQAVVVKVVDEFQNDSLEAYVTRKKKIDVSRDKICAEVLELLATQLPANILPASIEVLEKLPLLSNGKIDYKSLQDLKLKKQVPYVTPQNEVEQKVSTIWKEILGNKEISVDANFNSVGGNSLSMMNLISKINRDFTVKISLSQLFENPTIRKQASLLKSLTSAENTHIPTAPSKQYFKLSSAQRSIYFLYELHPESVAYNMPQLASLQGNLPIDAVERAFHQLVRRHEALRTSFHVYQGEVVQKIHTDFQFKIECFESDPNNIDELISSLIRPFDLTQAPLFRAALIRMAHDHHVLVVDLPHIIADGASQYVLMKDFFAFYQEQQLPALNIQYKDFAEWQQSEKEQNRIQALRSAWIEELGALPVPLAIPADFERPLQKQYEGSATSLEIDPERVSKLKAVAERHGVTMFMLFSSLYTWWLSLLSKQTDVVIGASITSRAYEEMEGVVGMFVNTLPLRLTIQGNTNFAELLQQSKRRTLRLMELSDYPFDDLVDSLNVPRTASNNPLFDCVIAYQNFDDIKTDIDDLTVRPYVRKQKESKFDLTLFVFEKKDRLQLDFEYAASLFKEKTIENLISFFDSLVDLVVSKDGFLLSSASPRRTDSPLQLTTAGQAESGGFKNSDISANAEDIKVKLVSIWREILGGNADVNENTLFNQAGGNSLKLLQLINKLYHSFGLNVPLRVLFNRSSISQLADYIMSVTPTGQGALPTAVFREYYPISGAQEPIFFVANTHDDTLLFNQPKIIIIDGHLDFKKLENALASMIERHEIFRTSFHVHNDRPAQKIHANVKLDLQILRCSEREVQKIIRESMKPFDLSRPPLLRACIISTSAVKHFFVMDVHHIIMDGISDGIFMAELGRLYNGESLQVPAHQYKDYSEWTFSTEHSARVDEMQSFWKKKFADEVPVLRLPKDNRLSSGSEKYEGGANDFEIPKQLSDRMRALANNCDTTMFAVVLAMFNVLLAKLSNQDDVVVGILSSGRDHPDVEKMPGMFVRDIPVRNSISGDRTFKSFLSDVKDSYLESIANQSFRFMRTTDPSAVDGNALYNAFLIYPNFDSVDIPSLPGLKCSFYDLGGVTELRYDLTLVVNETTQGLRCRMCSNQSVSPALRERFTEYFLRVLDQVSENPAIEIGAISLLTDREMEDTLTRFDETRFPLDTTRGVWQIFDEQAKRFPGRVAVEHNSESVTYQQLSRRIHGMSGCLINQGVQPGQHIAVHLPRGIDSVVAIISILQCGAVYIPIDVDFPENRVQELIADSESKFVITSTLSPSVDFPDSLCVINIKKAIEFPVEKPESRDADMDSLAYIIYTSGTTGKPKGAMIHHKGMLNHLLAKVSDLNIGQEDIIAQTASPCFDISIWQFLAALLVGGRVVIIDKDTALDPAKLFVHLREKAITIFQTVPSILRTLLEDVAGDTSLPHMRWMVPTGEQLSMSLVKRWYEHFPEIPMLNAYGPTEASDDVTHAVIARPSQTDTIVPIGKAIRNTHVYILDKHQQLCPPFVEGEIVVTGAGIGKGYWKAPEKTNTLFISNPLKKIAHDSDYRVAFKTGDKGYYLASGEIVCLGRLDEQLKIRGIRIEPAEIEAAVLKHEGVKQGVVISVKNQAANDALALFITADKALDTQLLRKSLQQHLPEYMIPTHIIQLDRIPLTKNGKTDKKALLEKLTLLKSAEHEIEMPKSQTEKDLAGIWSIVLGIERVGVSHTFFELGGNSLRIITLMSKVNAHFKTQLTVRDFFRYTTVSQMAEQIDLQAWVQEDAAGAYEVTI